MDDLSDEMELHALIEYVLENYPLSSSSQQKAAGIAKQVMDKGLSSLSEKQRWLFDTEFGPLLCKRQDQLDAEYRAYLLSRDNPP